MHTYPVQLNPAANEELIDVLKSNPALLKQVRTDGGIVNRFPPTDLISIPRDAGPSNGRTRQPPHYRRRFPTACTEGCFCPRVPPDGPWAGPVPKVRKTGSSPDSESDGSDEDAPH